MVADMSMNEQKKPPSTQSGASSMLGLRQLVEDLGKTKLWLILGLASVGISIGGYHFGDRYGLVVGFFIALGLDALIFFYDEWRLLNQFPSEEIEGNDAWGLNSLARRLAKRLGHRTPSLREI